VATVSAFLTVGCWSEELGQVLEKTVVAAACPIQLDVVRCRSGIDPHKDLLSGKTCNRGYPLPATNSGCRGKTMFPLLPLPPRGRGQLAVMATFRSLEGRDTGAPSGTG